jgi:hypothetical protein
MTFIEKCLAGTAKPEEIDDYVDAWHDSGSDDGSLPDYLGMSEVQYSRWVADSDEIYNILQEEAVNRESGVHSLNRLLHPSFNRLREFKKGKIKP